MPTTPAAMDWDLTSYFAEFDGPAMRQFKDELQRDLATAREQAAALAPLAEDNADSWEAVFLRTEELTDRLSHLGSYLGCLTAADARNEDYAREEAAFALLAQPRAKSSMSNSCARSRTPPTKCLPRLPNGLPWPTAATSSTASAKTRSAP